MPITFLNADLEVFARQPLQAFSEALSTHGHRVSELHCGEDGEGGFLARYEVHLDGSAEEKIHAFCEMLEALTGRARQCFDSADRRVIDLGYETADFCRPLTDLLSVPALGRLSALNIGLALTIYPPTISPS